MAISMFYYGKSFSLQRKLSVLPIVFGVALAFYGDMSFTPIGAFYTLFCVVLAALKAVAGGELLTGDLKLHEIDLLSKMCPLALLQIGLVSVLTGKCSIEPCKYYCNLYLCLVCTQWNWTTASTISCLDGSNTSCCAKQR
jgi:drug/metabolite transporter (DMT)-like permease